ncbi:MAG: M23 family metallopeptidase [Chloracidobacterium sp.]|nr:M23 family metallopeptidase [Chloracidobacterium sp.]
MQKNDKSYAFLLSHSSKSRIYIKRIAISKRYAHFGSVSVFLFLCCTVLGAGIGSLIETPVLAEAFARTSLLTRVAAETVVRTPKPDPAEPAAGGDYALNSGGPANNEQPLSGDPEIDSEVLAIRNNADPDFLPTMWAHLGKINNEFGFRRNPFGGRAYEFHPGMDIDGERGDVIVAPANGTVISAGYKGGYGNLVEIDHGNGLTTRYGHMSKIEAEVGQTITRGTTIGQVGSTGRSTGPHLHFEVRLNDKPINPRLFLPAEPVDLNAIER